MQWYNRVWYDSLFANILENVMKPTAQLFQPDPVSGYITIFVEGKQHTIHATDSNFASAVTAFEASDWDGLYNILNPAQMFQNLYAKYEQIEVKHATSMLMMSQSQALSLVASLIFLLRV